MQATWCRQLPQSRPPRDRRGPPHLASARGSPTAGWLCMPERVRPERVVPERIGVLLVDAAAVAVGRGDAAPRPALAGSGSGCVRPQRVPEGVGVLFVGSLAAAVAGRARLGLLFAGRL